MLDRVTVGRVYRAKKPLVAAGGYVNDRKVVWVAADESAVQFDGPAVANGRRLPWVKRDAFIAWASHDVTNELPPERWMTWSEYREMVRTLREEMRR